MGAITITANGASRPARASCPLPEFLAELGLAPERVVVERNGAALTPTEARATVLADGDRLEIVRIVAGG
jgi:thiamine biosynthesis protein ThiS